MSLIKCALAFMMAVHSYAAAMTPTCEEILHYVEEKLPQCGILKQNEEGFIFIDVDDAYIHQLIRYIQNEGYVEPPYFGSPELVGAHITVAYPEEADLYSVHHFIECGCTYYFQVMDCMIVHPLDWPDIESVYVITVKAPELDAFRKKYGLPKKSYEFHITVGVKPKFYP